jgi:hypothetical protein
MSSTCHAEEALANEINSSPVKKIHDEANVRPSSAQPVSPPIMIFTGRPSCAIFSAALSAPLQCGPAQ